MESISRIPGSSDSIVSQQNENSSLNKKIKKINSAAESGNWTFVDELLKADDVTRCDIEQSCLLHKLAAAPEVSLSLARDILTKILNCEVSINLLDEHEDTAIMLAARCDNTKMVMELLSRQAALPQDVTHVCSFLQTLTKNWKQEETPYMHALVVKLLWDRLQDRALHTCHKELHDTLVRLAVTFHTSLVREMFVTEQQVNTLDSEGMAVLHRLAMFDSDDHVRLVPFLISKGANINLQNYAGDTPLHVAAKNNNWMMMEALLHQRANSDVMNNEQQSALHTLATCEDTSFCEFDHILPLLIFNSSDLNKKDNKGNTALHLAALTGNIWFMKTLLDHGARADGVNDKQQTVLHMMAINEDEAVSEITLFNVALLIIKKGADVHKRDSDGDLAIHCAARHDNWDMMNILLKYSDVDLYDSKGYNILHEFARGSHSSDCDMFYELTHQVSDINARCQTGDAAIHLAADYGHWEIVKLLIKEGAIFDELDTEGFNVLHRRAMEENWSGLCPVYNKDTLTPSVEDFLLFNFRIKGISYNIPTLAGDVPLHLAARHNNWLMVKLLAEAGENIDENDSDGLTVIQRLVMSTSDKVSEQYSLFCRLLELGADFTCRDQNGDTLLHLAAKTGRWDIVQYLVELGEKTDTPDSEGFLILHRAVSVTLDFNEAHVLDLLLNNNQILEKRTKRGDTAIHLAAQREQWENVITLIKHGADVFDSDSENTNVLHRMIQSPSSLDRSECILNIIITSRIRENLDRTLGTLLYDAARCGRWEVVIYLMNQGVSIHSDDLRGFSLLHIVAKGEKPWYSYESLCESFWTRQSCSKHCLSLHTIAKDKQFTGQYQMVCKLIELLLSKEIGLEERCPDGNTALQLAAKFNNWDLVRCLAEKGANCKDPDSEGVFVLQRLAMHKEFHGDMIILFQHLIQKGADARICCPSGESLLHLGSRAKNWSFVDCIIKETNDLDLNKLDSDGFNVMHRLAQSDNGSKWLKNVLMKPLGLEDRCSDGNTALQLAAKLDNWDVVRCLAEHGANCKDPDSEGVFVLQRLAMYKEFHGDMIILVQHLIQKGADARICCPNGESLLHLGSKANNWSFVDCFIKETNDLDLDKLDNDGFNVMHRLAQSDNGSKWLENFLMEPFNINTLSRNGETCLLLAAKQENWIFVERFLEIVLKTKPPSACEIFHDFMLEHHLLEDMIKKMAFLGLLQNDDSYVTEKINLDQRDICGYTVWHLVVKRKVWLSGHLAECGANTDLVDDEGLGVLHALASANNVDYQQNSYLLKLISKKRLLIKAKNGLGNTPLQVAAKNSNLDFLVLLHCGAHICSKDSDGLSLLHRIVQIIPNDDVSVLENVIKYLLMSGANVNEMSEHNETPLHLAAKINNWSIVGLLIRHGAQAALCDSEGQSVLHRFASRDGSDILPREVQLQLTQELLDAGADIQQTNLQGNTSLHLAVQYQNWDVAQGLVQCGAEINDRDSEGYTVLHRLAQVQYLSVQDPRSFLSLTQLLLEKEARCDISTNRGETIFDIVTENENWIIMKCLLAQGMLAIGEYSEECLLHRLASCNIGDNYTDVCKLLIEKGLSVNAKDPDGNTPLHLAAKAGNWFLVEFLLQKGANGKMVNGNGLSILHIFFSDVKRDNGHRLEVILSSGVDVNAADPRGNTALHMAAKLDLNIEDSEGFTVLLRLSQTHPKCLPICQRLVQAGADINTRSSSGVSALELAIRSNNWPVVHFLLHSGAQFDVKVMDQLYVLHHLIKCSTSTIPLDNLLNVVTLFANSGVSLNNPDSIRQTPADLALKLEKWDVLVHLLEQGGRFNNTERPASSGFLKLAKTSSDGVKATRLLIGSGMDINLKNRYGNTPVHDAANEGRWDIVKIFVEHGADTNMPDSNGYCLLHNLASCTLQSSDHESTFALLNTLVQYKADVNWLGPDKKTAFQTAFDKRNWEMVGWLIELGALYELSQWEVDDALSYLHFFLMKNVEENKINSFINYLMDATEVSREFIQTILERCIQTYNWKMAKAVAKCGADVTYAHEGQTLLQLMMSSYSQINHAEWVSFLDEAISRGLDINAEHQNGSGIFFYQTLSEGVLFHEATLKSLTCEEESADCLFNALLERGADPLCVDFTGVTLLRKVVNFDEDLILNALKKLLPTGVTTHQPKFSEAKRGLSGYIASPTEKVICGRNVRVLEMLIKSGTSSNAELFRLYRAYQKKLARRETEVLDLLKVAATQVRSLKSLCRLAVSHCLACGPKRQDRIQYLPIPPPLKRLIVFCDIINPESQEQEGEED